MNAIVIATLTFGAASMFALAMLLVLGDTVFRYRGRANARIEEECRGGAAVSQETSLFKDFGNLRVDLKDARRGSYERVLRWLAESATKLRVGDVLAACTVVSCGAAFVVSMLQTPIWTSVVVGTFGGEIPIAYIELSRRKRVNELRNQLPEAFDLMSRAVRAGRTMPAAVQAVADEMSAPIATEFAHCHEQQRLGISLGEAVQEFAQRSAITELQLFAVGLIVQSRSGGNIVELLNNLSSTIRQRRKLQAKMRAITAEGRMQAVVLGAVPVALFLALLAFAPDYVSSLYERPSLLVVTGCCQLAGVWWIRSIVKLTA